jgi:hypothetical protein
MSCLLFSMVAYAGNKVPEAPFPVNFDPDIFDETSTTIDNEWWPLPPGKQMTWEGTALDDEGEKIPRKVVFTVTDMTKEIAGVRTVVGWDRDFQDGELTESELIFLAQSKDGAVWHLGESVEHFEDRPEINAKAGPGSTCPPSPSSGMLRTTRALHPVRGTGTTGPRSTRWA